MCPSRDLKKNIFNENQNDKNFEFILNIDFNTPNISVLLLIFSSLPLLSFYHISSSSLLFLRYISKLLPTYKYNFLQIPINSSLHRLYYLLHIYSNKSLSLHTKFVAYYKYNLINQCNTI